LQEEVDVRIQCMLRSVAASCGDLVPLFCEESLADPKFKGKAGHVDKALLAASHAARSAANKLLAGDAATDGDTVKAPLLNLMSPIVSVFVCFWGFVLSDTMGGQHITSFYLLGFWKLLVKPSTWS
jgi:hypothetical protein